VYLSRQKINKTIESIMPAMVAMRVKAGECLSKSQSRSRHSNTRIAVSRRNNMMYNSFIGKQLKNGGPGRNQGR